MKIIGDIGSCHLGKWEYIQEAIDVAKSSGLDILKFQLFEGNKNGNIEFPRRLWPKTVDYAKKAVIDIFASVFDLEAIKLLEDTGIKKAKLSYHQNFNLKLIRELKKKHFEIWASGDDNNCPHYADKVFFCIPEYPVKKRMPAFMENKYDGFSSHFLGFNVDEEIMRNFGFGCLEKHFTLNHDDIDVPDHWFALMPEELKEMVKCLKL